MNQTQHYLLGQGYRAYHPVLMRFNRPDNLSPFGPGGLNAYAYGRGDPLNRRDPSGHVAVLSLLTMVGSTALTVTSGALSLLSEARAREATGSASQSDLETIGLILGSVVGGGVMLGGLFDKVSDFVNLSRKSLVRRYSFDGAPPSSPARNLIENEVAGIENPSSFTMALRTTNLNLRSHGDSSLSIPHARTYVDLSKQVESGRRSNTGAHVQAAQHWGSVPGPGGQVGQVFNFAAAFWSGAAVDARLRKTGKALRK